MKRTIFLFILLAFVINGFSQNFYHEDFNHRKNYLILANPTVGNIQSIQYLVANKLLDVNLKKVKFVGVYFEGQAYDFSKTVDYLNEKKLKNFFLHEVKGNLNEQNLYGDNDCVADLKIIFNNSIGVFFFGGLDIPPGVYGEDNSLSVVTDPNRHYFETTFLYHLLGGFQDGNFHPWLDQKPRYLVTGFCLGMQTMNVATGGTLIQDIPAEIYNALEPKEILKIGRNNLHRNYWQEIVDDSMLMGINLHKIRFSEHPFFGKTIKMAKGWQPRIYSNHHQAVEKIGKGLEVTAYSMDGKVIEGLAHARYPDVFAVQFHPEVPALYEDLYKRKFHPDDQPNTYHNIIGRSGVKFHKTYWKHISKIIAGLK